MRNQIPPDVNRAAALGPGGNEQGHQLRIVQSRRIGGPVRKVDGRFEAQAAGVPVVMADGVPHDAVVVPELCTRLSLDAPLPVWANALRRPATVPRAAALTMVAASDFALHRGFTHLLALYGGRS